MLNQRVSQQNNLRRHLKHKDFPIFHSGHIGCLIIHIRKIYSAAFIELPSLAFATRSISFSPDVLSPTPSFPHLGCRLLFPTKHHTIPTPFGEVQDIEAELQQNFHPQSPSNQTGRVLFLPQVSRGIPFSVSL
jgi:hypothetical protein